MQSFCFYRFSLVNAEELTSGATCDQSLADPTHQLSSVMNRVTVARLQDLVAFVIEVMGISGSSGQNNQTTPCQTPKLPAKRKTSKKSLLPLQKDPDKSATSTPSKAPEKNQPSGKPPCRLPSQLTETTEVWNLLNKRFYDSCQVL